MVGPADVPTSMHGPAQVAATAQSSKPTQESSEYYGSKLDLLKGIDRADKIPSDHHLSFQSFICTAPFVMQSNFEVGAMIGSRAIGCGQ